ncbi:multicopper oxidase domain-containing protein [Tomitella biformata]|uniref:multicopper oxidase domain-containing protein n=1 Tax=Tomitella biformata TaxID=630403 RepID=UPI000464A54B|nr:multicopper oxidase domain-containing protein [Tomitella biformata]
MKLGTWHLRVGSIVLAWLIALLGVAIAHDHIPQSPWLLVHLLGLGAATNAILIWSWYFTEAVLRLGRDAGQRAQAIRLGGLNLGALSVVVGMVTGTWLAVLIGGILVGAVILWHAAAMAYTLHKALPSRFGPMVRFYAASGVALPIGVGLGVTMADSRLPGQWYSQFIVSHALINVFGWIGLTVLGTLVTLWPTILRTRMAAGVEKAALRGLPVLGAGLIVAVGGALGGLIWLTAVGLAIYTGATGYVLWPHIDEARRKRPLHFPSMSVFAGVLWLLGSLAALTVGFALSSTWMDAEDWLRAVVPALVVGFLAQVLLGALSYLMPVVLGNRPSATQIATAALNRVSSARITMVNGALLLCVLPTPDRVQQLSWIVVAVGLGSFVPLMVYAWLLARRAGTGPITRPDPRNRLVDPHEGRRLGHALAGLGVVVLVAAIGVAIEPGALPSPTGPTTAAAATGEVTRVAVKVDGYRFVPAVIDVPAGNQLIIDFDNTGDMRHDLVLANGARSPMLAAGERHEIDAGVIGVSMAGWCSVAGHRQLGMVLQVNATGAGAMPGHEAGSPGLDLRGEPGPDFHPRDAALPPAIEATVHKVDLAVTDSKIEVAPGYTQTLWPYGGSVPGPVLRGKVGDRFEVTLHNNATMGHSIDFHAGSLAPDGPMRTIEPGESLTYDFTATKSGIWMYHCSTMPMSMHIANGMFGAVIIDPPNLAPVDREYVLVQSEMYLGPDGEVADGAKINAETPDLVVFNGYPNQYDRAPLTAKVGERVRIWVLAAGPNRGTAFHVVGGQFDTVWKEGAYTLRPGNPDAGGSQTLDLSAAQGGFVELAFPEAGDYPFVNHSMVDAERGAHGLIRVTD